MTTTAQIDNNINSLRKYFGKLFELLQMEIKENKKAPMEVLDSESIESQETYFYIDHLIKPDMLIHIYSLVDFWIKQICNQHQKRCKLNLGYDDFKKSKCKGKSDLACLHNYLTKVVGINLDSVKDSYKHLDNLRLVRNVFIHSGGHIFDEKKKKDFSKIGGISLVLSLIEIDDNFIFESLDHSKKYLFEAAKF